MKRIREKIEKLFEIVWAGKRGWEGKRESKLLKRVGMEEDEEG